MGPMLYTSAEKPHVCSMFISFEYGCAAKREVIAIGVSLAAWIILSVK